MAKIANRRFKNANNRQGPRKAGLKTKVKTKGKFISGKGKKGVGQRRPLQQNLRVKQRKATIQDVRNKIIANKRRHLVDARDVLASMAKTQDARSKLEKLRHTKGRTAPGGVNIRQIGVNIVRKTDRNGKISLMTTGAGSTSKAGNSTGNKRNFGPAGKRQQTVRKNQQQQQNFNRNLANFGGVQQRRPQRTSNAYKWTKPAASQLISSLQSRADRALENFVLNSAIPCLPPGYKLVPDDDDMPMVRPSPPKRQTIVIRSSPPPPPPPITTLSSGIHSRLDTSPPSLRNVIHSTTHGIFGRSSIIKSKPPTTTIGYRIMVSNLQPTVTQDDIKELFEDIGELVAAKFLRDGVAEVIYKNLKDAQKAVDTYHNRQLDGHPMKCLSKGPVEVPATSTGQRDVKTYGQPQSSKDKLVPDLDTIHKVLFRRN